MFHENFDRQGITDEEAKERWEQAGLSAAEKTDFVIKQSFIALNMRRYGDEPYYFGDLELYTFEELCKQLHGYGSELMAQIYLRLAKVEVCLS